MNRLPPPLPKAPRTIFGTIRRCQAWGCRMPASHSVKVRPLGRAYWYCCRHAMVRWPRKMAACCADRMTLDVLADRVGR